MSFLSSAAMESQFRDAAVRTVVAKGIDFSISKDGSEDGLVQMNFIHSCVVSSCQRLPVRHRLVWGEIQ